MNVKKVVSELKSKYLGKKIVLNPRRNPTEVICEVGSNVPEIGLAVAVIDKSVAHYHKKITESYKIIKGQLSVYIGNKKYVLNKGEKIVIKPGKVHFAEGNETWVEVISKPAWSPEDHHLK